MKQSAGFVEFGKNRFVTEADMRRCAESACRVILPHGQTVRYARILHFIADDQEVHNPIGLECRRLGATALLVIGEARGYANPTALF